MQDNLSEEILSACITVHAELGPGHLEAVYARALILEFTQREIPFQTEVPVQIRYRGETVGEGRLDFLIRDSLILEIKSVADLLPLHSAQTISYLKMTDLPLALLVNFNVALLKHGIRRLSHPRIHANTRRSAKRP